MLCTGKSLAQPQTQIRPGPNCTSHSAHTTMSREKPLFTGYILQCLYLQEHKYKEHHRADSHVALHSVPKNTEGRKIKNNYYTSEVNFISTSQTKTASLWNFSGTLNNRSMTKWIVTSFPTSAFSSGRKTKQREQSFRARKSHHHALRKQSSIG